MIHSIHTVSHCNVCGDDIVICAHHCNNCYNGGTGTLSDGSQCGCEEAYEHQTILWNAPSSITFARDIRVTKDQCDS